MFDAKVMTVKLLLQNVAEHALSKLRPPLGSTPSPGSALWPGGVWWSPVVVAPANANVSLFVCVFETLAAEAPPLGPAPLRRPCGLW